MMLSLVIPAFNEQEGIGAVLKSLMDLKEARSDVEVIVVNDGSTDNTAEIIRSFDVRLVEHRNRKGYGAALKSGIRTSQGAYIVLCDSDGQHRLEDIQRVIELAPHYDMVVGARAKGSYRQTNRILGKTILTLVANYLAGEKISDINSGLRSFKKDLIVKYLHLLPDSFSASTTSTMIFLKCRYDILWTPIKTVRRSGKSSVRQLRHGLYTLFLLLRIVTLFHPLKVFFPMAGVLAIAGTVWGIIYLPTGGFSVFSAILILSGLIVFMFGLLCDQVSQMRLEKYE